MGNHQINLIKRGFAAWQRYGTRTFIEKTVDYLAGQVQDRFDPVPYALGVDWRVPPRPQLINSQPLDLEHPVINWVIPHVGQGGGHRTIFRFVRYLQERGFRQRIYEMPIRRRRRSNPRELHDLIRQLYGISLSEVHPDFQAMQPADITIATAWQTAYAVFQFPETRHKVYLVQDYEPYFTPVGTVSALAENTYRFGFYGITAGAWLADKLSGEFDMSCDQFQLAVDSEIYHPLPTGEHNKVFFYARPVTARRGFELGARALEIFHSRNPQYEIVLAGGEVSGSLSFPVKNLGYVSEQRLNEVYNQSAAALVVSLTNCSLLPLEIMATGCPVVTTIGENNQKLLPPDSAIYAIPSPHHLAQALETAVRNVEARERLALAAQERQWQPELEKVESILRRLLQEAG